MGREPDRSPGCHATRASGESRRTFDAAMWTAAPYERAQTIVNAMTKIVQTRVGSSGCPPVAKGTKTVATVNPIPATANAVHGTKPSTRIWKSGTISPSRQPVRRSRLPRNTSHSRFLMLGGRTANETAAVDRAGAMLVLASGLAEEKGPKAAGIGTGGATEK